MSFNVGDAVRYSTSFIRGIGGDHTLASMRGVVLSAKTVPFRHRDITIYRIRWDVADSNCESSAIDVNLEKSE